MAKMPREGWPPASLTAQLRTEASSRWVWGDSILGMEPDHMDQAFAPACFSQGGSPGPEAPGPKAAVPTGRLWTGKLPTQAALSKTERGQESSARRAVEVWSIRRRLGQAFPAVQR